MSKETLHGGGTHRCREVTLLLVERCHALHHLTVGFRVAVLEGELLQLLLDGVQAQQARQRGKDLQTPRSSPQVQSSNLTQ